MERALDADVFAPGSLAVASEHHHLKGDRPQHSHAFVEIALVVSGRARHLSGHGDEYLGPGSVVLVRPGQWHAYRNAADLRVWNVYVGTGVLGGELTGLPADPVVTGLLWSFPGPGSRVPGATTLGTLAPKDLDIALGAAADMTTGATGPGARTAALGRLLLFIASLAPLLEAPTGGTANTADTAALTARRLLETDPARSWTVGELASAVHLSAGALSRRFSAALGLPPMAYLARRRAEIAARLLITTDRPVSEIGAMVGWPDPNYAARRFRSATGMSPSTYRAAFRPR